ncbi:hypothetical protein F4825DRAFT_145323 [Nemania diffusa]|nr:hypothetical protein F4825DRAFT_145323 [Nemania diffusa]
MTSTHTDVALRNPLPLPRPTAPLPEVAFCHPYYDPPHDVLFRLPRLDHNNSSLVKGIHYGTAFAACQIIANNASDGYLATDRAGKHRVTCTYDSLLTSAKYWFFDAAPTTDPSSSTVHPKLPYPVVPSFQDWAFPHQYFNRNVGEEYEQDDVEQSNSGQRNHNDQNTGLSTFLTNWHQPGTPVLGRCIVTYTSGLIHSAHLIPGADREWFERNAMSGYGTHHDIDQSANKINLRNDIHAAFGNHWFVIVPKNGSYAIHVLSTIEISPREFSAQYHNIPVLQQLQQIPTADIPTNIPPEFLYARFARAILLLSKPFVAQSPASRRVARYVVRQSSDNPEAAPRTTIEWLSSEELHQQYGGGGTRSASPSKRKRESEQKDLDINNYSGSDDVNNSDTETIESNSNFGGSKRRQRRQFTPTPSTSDVDIDTSLEEEDKRGRSRKRRRLCGRPKEQFGLTPPQCVI